MTFSELKTEVNLLVIDTPTAVQQLVGRFINRAIRKLQKKHNFKINEASVTYTTTVYTRGIGLVPTDFHKLRGQPFVQGFYGDNRDLAMVANDREALIAYGSNSSYDYGYPRLLFNDGTNFNVYPYPDGLSNYSDGEYRIVVNYWKLLPDLSADTDTNWFSENADEWIIYKAVADAFYANEDEDRAMTWEKRAAREYDDIVKIDKYIRLGDLRSMVPHTGANSPHTQE